MIKFKQGKKKKKNIRDHHSYLILFNFPSINLRKEVADGIRIYFDFLLRDYLLYQQERDQANLLLSDENLINYTYISSESQ